MEILLLISDFALVSFASIIGIHYLRAFMVANILLIGLLGSKELVMFGFTSNIGNIFYATVILGSCLMLQLYGEREARKTIQAVGFTAIGVALLQVIPSTSRILVASLTAFMLAQTVLIYSWQWFGRLRVLGSSIVAQAVDSIVFFPLAFLTQLPVIQMVDFAWQGFVLKAMFAVASLPFFFAVKRIGVR